MNTSINTLVIPAAGAGTRLRPATHVTPKELLRLVDRPIIWYLLKEAYVAGIRRVIVVINSDSPATKYFFESDGAKHLLEEFPDLTLSFVEVSTRGGDGEAILAARSYVGNLPFAVSMGDMVTLPGESILRELAGAYEQSGPMISVELVERSRTDQYGVIKTKDSDSALHMVEGIVEKPTPEEAPSTLAMTGKYILESSIFDDLAEITKEQVGKGEVKLAHALNRYASRASLYALEPEAKHYDTGTKQALFETEVIFSLAHKDIGERARTFFSNLK